MLEEFRAAEIFLQKAGLKDVELPIPLERVIDFMTGQGLELRYYDPRQAPPQTQEAATGVDEVLVRQKEGNALLFVNSHRPWVRQRFSIFHGIGHFLLPSHLNLNYLSRGCSTSKIDTHQPFENQANRFAAALNMPPNRFRTDMAVLPFGMTAIEQLAQRYSASVESTGIHYVQLADVPCAFVRFDSVSRKIGNLALDVPYKVRYQVSSTRFPFRIKPGTVVQQVLDERVRWVQGNTLLLPEGIIRGEHLGLEPGTVFTTCLYPTLEIASVYLALFYPGMIKPESVIDLSKPN